MKIASKLSVLPNKKQGNSVWPTFMALTLYVVLAYIGKVHGLTPHSSTDRCPFELIKKGNLPSLFPNQYS